MHKNMHFNGVKDTFNFIQNKIQCIYTCIANNLYWFNFKKRLIPLYLRLTTTISFADMAEQFASIEYQWYKGNKFVDSSHIVFHNLKALSELVKHTQQMSKNHYLIDFFLLYIWFYSRIQPNRLQNFIFDWPQTMSLKNLNDTKMYHNSILKVNFNPVDQTCDEGTSCPFSRLLTLESNLVICRDIYKISPSSVPNFVEFTNEYYGANRPKGTRVLFVNGKI